MHQKAYFLFVTLCALLLSSCSLVEQRLASESGLYDVPLTHSIKVPVDGYWTWGKGNAAVDKKDLCFYVAPLDVSRVQEDHPELAPTMVMQMHDLMRCKLTEAFNEANAANQTRWHLTEQAGQADLRIDLAVVTLRKRRPILHIVAKVLGYVAPTGVGDAVDLIAEGDITIEGTIRRSSDNALLLAFKDANRAPLRFYHKNTYLRTGHVDANLKLWAEKLARLCRESAHDRLGDSTLKEKVKNRSMGDVIRTRVQDAL